jgi:enoyl-CoA hydratase/carnithine racemase
VPLLGVLPGTGGLTRLTDKRHVRRDLADVFCTTAEGVRGQRARDWALVDAIVKPQNFHEYVRQRAQALAATSERPKAAAGVALPPLDRVIEPQGFHYRFVDVRLAGSCFVGSLLELALASDRVYMLNQPAAAGGPVLVLSEVNFGLLPAVHGRSRVDARFYGDAKLLAEARAAVGSRLECRQAEALGLVTSGPDALDWDHEIRIALEERGALSPDALTGMEANLRFGPGETLETRVFGRLSAWQNWIFIRPNAVGEAGALKVFGTGRRAQFNRDRI